MTDEAQVATLVEALSACPMVGRIIRLTTDEQLAQRAAQRDTLFVPTLFGTEAISAIARSSRETPFLLYYTKYTPLSIGYLALERMVQVMRLTNAGMVYADRYQQDGEERCPAPVIDCQRGSLRDDFDFGSLLLFRTDIFRSVAASMTANYRFAGLYDLRLRLSERAPIEHIHEYLYTEVLSDRRKSGEKIFDYVDPRNRDAQVEMEQACTDHLRSVGAYLSPDSIQPIALDAAGFAYEASVIIPVRNRVRTIEDAIRSVLSQQAAQRTSSGATPSPTRASSTSSLSARISASVAAGTSGCSMKPAGDSPCSWIAMMCIRTSTPYGASWRHSAGSNARWSSAPT